MTSKLTRERIELIANFHRAMTLPPSHAEIEELARMALAAMDSESGCLPLDYLQGHKDGLEWAAQLAEANHHETGDWLYDDPIELAKAIRKGPDMPPVQPAQVVPDDVLKALQKVARIRLDIDGFDGDRRGIADCLCDAEEALIEVVNRRAAMLQELKKSAGTEAICRSDENVQVLHTKSPAQSDCCPAQNSVTPAQGGNSLVIPDEMTSGQAYEIGYYYGDPVDVFARGANWMRQHIIDSTLAAAPQEVKGE